MALAVALLLGACAQAPSGEAAAEVVHRIDGSSAAHRAPASAPVSASRSAVAPATVSIRPTQPVPSTGGSSSSGDWQRLRLGTAAGAYVFPVHASASLNADLSRVRHVILWPRAARQGAGSADSAASSATASAALDAMKAAGVDPARTVLIEPLFVRMGTAAGSLAGAAATDMPSWAGQEWGSGDPATVGPSIPSIRVLEDLLAYLSDRNRWAGLTRITVAGHGDGARLVQRLSVLNDADERLRARGVDVRYVIANPTAYLYLTSDRPTGDGFAVPSASQCAGLDHGSAGARSDPRRLWVRLSKRRVVYLLGSESRAPAAVGGRQDVAPPPAPGEHCADRLQGGSVLERGYNWLRYERFLAGQGVGITHQAFEVEGVGLDAAAMLGSKCASMAVFGRPESNNPTGAACRAPDLWR